MPVEMAMLQGCSAQGLAAVDGEFSPVRTPSNSTPWKAAMPSLRPAVTSCPGFSHSTNMPGPASPIVAQRETIIRRLSAGDMVGAIAADLGVHRFSISRRMTHDADYQAAMTEGLEARLELREQELEGATDPVCLARTRELLSHARWRAERLNSSKYGQRPTVVNNVINGTLSDAELMRIAAPLLGVSEATGVMSNTIDAQDASVLDVETKAK